MTVSDLIRILREKVLEDPRVAAMPIIVADGYGDPDFASEVIVNHLEEVIIS